MNVSRRDLVVGSAFALGASGLLLSGSAGAETGDEAAVTQSVETLRKALLEADKAKLEWRPLRSATAILTEGSRPRNNSSTG